ncbi:MAG: 3-keto-5-aminohexanoate cleavage protein [Xanthomonadales bacterium]|nr:3-keto-5-aminohexanoate cleavage protein [Xanthomonadales bacterium]NIP75118.1 3-keto-5-aminohexanoate cleavage protein [Xanthomonadales bacterium]NIT09191.1 3-keto-5-aminohexanoate cleavage protein [Xanthomonadales bacterium]NIT34486.1 3-keto-5-aminohexanoate cleavage protein [Xanthomonadales bacterium]
MSAPNGARRTTADHPALPLTPAAIADTAGRLVDAGVAVLHLHVRDAAGLHTLDPDRYRAAIRAVRAAVGEDLIIQVTTEAVGRYRPEQQMDTVRQLRPEAVSLALNELCPDEGQEERAGHFFDWLQAEGIWPQYILYSPAELRRFDRLRRGGLFAEERPFCLLVLGSYARRVEGGPAELEAYRAAADLDAFPWAACCFGRTEQQMMGEALRLGGHVRLGFENNLWLPDGSLARDNAELVRRFLDSAPGPHRQPATAAETRRLWR